MQSAHTPTRLIVIKRAAQEETVKRRKKQQRTWGGGQGGAQTRPQIKAALKVSVGDNVSHVQRQLHLFALELKNCKVRRQKNGNVRRQWTQTGIISPDRDI